MPSCSLSSGQQETDLPGPTGSATTNNIDAFLPFSWSPHALWIFIDVFLMQRQTELSPSDWSYWRDADPFLPLFPVSTLPFSSLQSSSLSLYFLWWKARGHWRLFLRMLVSNWPTFQKCWKQKGEVSFFRLSEVMRYQGPNPLGISSFLLESEISGKTPESQICGFYVFVSIKKSCEDERKWFCTTTPCVRESWF